MAFREKTTFVIGAGASAEFGLPVGTGLAAEIKKRANVLIVDEDLSHPTYVQDYLRRTFASDLEHGEAASVLMEIHSGIHTANSIDAFIHRHQHHTLLGRLGKALIALEILRQEGRSTMAMGVWDLFGSDPNHVVDRGKKPPLFNPDFTWLGHFFRTMCDGVTSADEVGRNVKIICFNYDRCIEHYISESLAAAYLIDPSDALRIVEENIEIIHPYGYLGSLGGHGFLKKKGKVAFGEEITEAVDIEEIAGRIKTYTEHIGDEQRLDAVHNAMISCHNLVFLGFGFNYQNLNLLRVKGKIEDVDTPKNIYSTGHGLYKQIEGTLKRRIMDLFVDTNEYRYWENKIHVEFGVGCEEFFRIHDMNLASFSAKSVGSNVRYVDAESK